ncbi:hypothetical protein GUJ93_ZPchr0015g6846 [Zizania palustris]|uniref:Uncharacterized protein n=1 Tax=Zizania palustris TaxID=103762 RepID=A0A8J5SYN9_ZIZPA|nr:hypothetical protein GUJ93_ZPchr0015g6846 [Zizania palustris]
MQPSSSSEHEDGGDDDVDFTMPQKQKKDQGPSISDLEDKGHFSTMRCSPSAVYDLIEPMPENYKQRLTNMGFGEFFTVLPITSKVVQRIFGLPNGGRPFPKFSAREKEEARKELRNIWNQKGMRRMLETSDRQGANYRRLQKYVVPRWIIDKFSSTNAEEFDDWDVQCFFIIVCNRFLFPTSSYYPTGFDYLICKDIEALGGLDWCRALVDDIKDKAAIWKKKCGKKKTPIIQGCTALLIVYYLDNLDCPGVERNMDTPRWSQYSKGLIEKICNVDRLTFKNGSLSYSKLHLLSKDRTVYSDIRGDDERQSKGKMCSCLLLLLYWLGNIPFDLIELKPLMAQSIASFPDSSLKDAVKKALRQYDSSMVRVCKHKVVEAECAIENAKRQIQKGKLNLQKAQKKMLYEVVTLNKLVARMIYLNNLRNLCRKNSRVVMRLEGKIHLLTRQVVMLNKPVARMIYLKKIDKIHLLTR